MAFTAFSTVSKLALAAAATCLVVSGCTVSSGVPGLPDVKLVVPDSPAKVACRQYAQAFNDGTTKEAITAGLNTAQSTAFAAGADDTEAREIADAIDAVLTSTVVGTRQSLETANSRVIALCGNAGVTITME
ncbi:MAG: hypothetical protein WCI74_15915 [Actinomycetes bacterium]